MFLLFFLSVLACLVFVPSSVRLEQPAVQHARGLSRSISVPSVCPPPLPPSSSCDSLTVGVFFDTSEQGWRRRSPVSEGRRRRKRWRPRRGPRTPVRDSSKVNDAMPPDSATNTHVGRPGGQSFVGGRGQWRTRFRVSGDEQPALCMAEQAVGQQRRLAAEG